MHGVETDVRRDDDDLSRRSAIRLAARRDRLPRESHPDTRSSLAHVQHEGNLRHHLKAAGIPAEGSPRDWINDIEIRSYVLGALRGTAKIGGLHKHELVRDVILTPEEWSAIWYTT